MSDICKEDDPYVAEVHMLRDKLNKEANYDPAVFAEKAAEFARKVGMRLCTLKPVVPRFAS